MRVFVALAIVGVAAFGVTQDGSITRRTSKPSIAQAPVTSGEVVKSMNRVDAALRSVLGAKSAPAKPLPKDAQTIAKKDMIVRHFYALYEVAKPYFKYTPRPINVDRNAMRAAPPDVRAALEKLVASGCVGSAGPLGAYTSDPMTIQQFGDALGLLVARLAELTHTPSSKFSPYLQSGGG